MLSKHSRPRLLLIGDSITQFSFSVAHAGFGARLLEYYEGRRVDVVNRGFSGYNSRWIRQIILDIALPDVVQESLFVTILLGANDSVSAESPQHVPLDEYIDNITAIVMHLRSIRDSLIIFLITPPPVDREKWPSRDTAVVGMYAEGIRSLAMTLSTECVDLWNGSSAISVDDDLYDGLHLGSEGNRKVFDGIREVLSAKYPYLDPVTNNSDKRHGIVPLHFPHWSTLAGLSTEESKTILDDWKWF